MITFIFIILFPPSLSETRDLSSTAIASVRNLRMIEDSRKIKKLLLISEILC